MGEQSVTGFALEQKYAALLKTADATIRSVGIHHRYRGNIPSQLWIHERYRENPYRWFVGRNSFRYLRALDLILSSNTDGIVCDLGCFIPFLPVCLSLAGLRVKIVR